MSLGLADLKRWIEGLLPTTNGITPFVAINRLPPEPDVVVCAMPTGGTTQFLEGAAERRHVQMRVRANDDVEAEALMNQLHQAISAHESSFSAGATRILAIEPQSPPSYFGRDVDNRSCYSSSYLFSYFV